MEIAELIPVLQKISAEEKNKQKVEQINLIATTLKDGLDDLELMREAARTYANANMKQRDALFDIIKTYSKRIADAELSNMLMKEANRVIKNG